MLTPVLFVGVGGSGRSTLHWLYDDLRRELIRNGWPWVEREGFNAPMPRCWGFAAIDSDFSAVKDDPVLPPRALDEIGLAEYTTDMSLLHRRVVDGNAGFTRLGWLPENTELPSLSSPRKGMGQHRALGRIAALSNLNKIGGALENSARAVLVANAQNDLRALGETFDAEIGLGAMHARIVVISSMAGGTGAGVWLDVAQFFASSPDTEADHWRRENLMAVLYTPELYDELEGPKHGIGPNSLYAVGELISAYRGVRTPDPIEEDQIELVGGVRGDQIEMAPKSLVLIGTESGGVPFGSPTEAYASTARTFASLVLNASNMAAFDRVTVNADNENRLPVLGQAKIPAANIGFARVEVGSEAFSDYTARRIFRSAMTRLLEPDGDEYTATSERARATALQLRSDFFTDCGLREKNESEENNQILEAIDPSRDVEARRSAFRQLIDQDLKDMLGGFLGVFSKTDDLKDSLEGRVDDASADAQLAMLNRARDYARTVNDLVTSAVTRYSADYSVPVVVELLELLDEQLEAAAAELQDEIGERSRRIGARIEQFLKSRDSNDAARRFNDTYGIDRRRITIGFIHYVRQALVKPMQRAAESWLTAATVDVSATPELERVLDAWDGAELPTDLLPSPTTVRLTDLSNASERYEEVLTNALEPESRQFGRGQASAVRELVEGDWPGRRANRSYRFVETRTSFSLDRLRVPAPRTAESRVPGIAAAMDAITRNELAVTSAEFLFAAPAALYERAQDWSRTREIVTDQTDQRLSDYLDPNHPDHTRRRQSFADAVAQAAGNASPTGSYNAKAMQTIHGATKPVDSIRNSPAFPFSEQSRTGRAVSSSIGRLKLSTDELVYDEGAGDPRAVDFFRLWPNGVHPLALEAVSGPIRRSIRDADRSYLLARQSRPLSQTLGWSGLQLTAFLRGWIALQMLDLIDTEKGRVWLRKHDTGTDSTPARWERIPDDYLALARRTQPTNGSGWLYVALHSFLPRMVAASTNIKALEWYDQVLDFGGYHPTEEGQFSATGVVEARHDPVVIADLHTWTLTGKTPLRNRPANIRIDADDEVTSDLRRQRLLDDLSGMYDTMDEWASRARINQDAYVKKTRLAAEYELFPYTLTALGQLIAGLQTMDIEQRTPDRPEEDGLFG